MRGWITFGIIVVLCVMALSIFLFHFSRRNVDNVKSVAHERLAEFGYEVIAYEGYKHSVFAGGNVWYMVKKKNDNLRYSCYLTLWGGEYHLYGPKPIDYLHIRDNAPTEK